MYPYLFLILSINASGLGKGSLIPWSQTNNLIIDEGCDTEDVKQRPKKAYNLERVIWVLDRRRKYHFRVLNKSK
jgi:hypothetical protein